jgi:hypothetical protein
MEVAPVLLDGVFQEVVQVDFVEGEVLRSLLRLV